MTLRDRFAGLPQIIRGGVHRRLPGLPLEVVPGPAQQAPRQRQPAAVVGQQGARLGQRRLGQDGPVLLWRPQPAEGCHQQVSQGGAALRRRQGATATSGRGAPGTGLAASSLMTWW